MCLDVPKTDNEYTEWKNLVESLLEQQQSNIYDFLSSMSDSRFPELIVRI
jgi:hypothetical protein